MSVSNGKGKGLSVRFSFGSQNNKKTLLTVLNGVPVFQPH